MPLPLSHLGREPGHPWGLLPLPPGVGVVVVQGESAAGTLWDRLRSPASTAVFCKAFLLPSQ